MEQSCSKEESSNFVVQFGQPFWWSGLPLALDTSHTIIRHQWVALPMPPTVIDCINHLGRHEPAMLTFTDWQGHDIGDGNPQDANSVGFLDDN
jgi:hypothetical protein